MLGLLGISYKSAPLEIREKFSFTEAESIVFIKQLKIDPDLKGAVVLSTCNRIEVYFHYELCCSQKGFENVFRNLEFFKKTSPQERLYFYTKEGEAVADHLFRVVSGLESLILGEDQIVTQVKSGFKNSHDNDLSSSILTRMFNKAFEAGKRVRTETAINQGSASISSAAVELICKRMPDIKDKKIMLLGAGVMGELALVNLVKRDCNSIYITNRTYDKALELGKKYKLQTFKLEDLSDYLPVCDVVIVATGAQSHIVTYDMVNAFIHERQEKQLYMDISVPRNISTEIQDFSFIELFAVDDLQEIVKETQNKRKEAVSEAIEVINLVKQEFTDWLCSLELTPAILKIKKSIEDVNASELEGFIRINGITDQDEMVVRYAEHISQKYARLFIRNLKHITDNGKQREYVNMVNRLFELTDGHEQ
jgi:glutamyl-tRNA reductase